jgi:tRNA-Thr(GGU) m(6)t(6)A37 methyltransferase TsaA
MPGSIRHERDTSSLPAANAIEMQAIGVVHTDASEEEIRDRNKGVLFEVEVFPQFEEALDGIEGFSHILVIAYLDQLKPEQKGRLKVQPRKLLRYGLTLEELPVVGVFALDSPTRPNPIGLSLVPLLRREGRRLTVSDLDFFDETPVLDIKPYQYSYHTEHFEVPEWHSRILKKAGRV